MEEVKKVPVKRSYRASLFEMIFRNKKELLELYNAVNGTKYTDPDQLEINTLKNAIYMSMYNDVSFIIDSRLSLYEHQSTYNPNLPLRFLFYISDLYSVITRDRNLYGEKKVMLPTPNFLIFFNGCKNLPERMELNLSDLYEIPDLEPSLELKAVMLNINPGKNEALKEACKTLKDYAEYTWRVSHYAETMPLEDAVEQAIEECIQEGILAEFLSKNRSEAKSVSIYEYDEARHMRQTREEGREEGREEERLRINSMIQKLVAQNRVEDIVKAASDPKYQEQLLNEFGL